MSNDNVMSLLSKRKQELFQLDSEIIKFWRRNPVIACRDLLGIELLDAQKYILMETWVKPYSLWCCSRNFGKSLLGAVYMMLKFLLFEKQRIFIVAPQGKQSQDTFQKIEDIAKQNIISMPSINDIFASEVVTSGNNPSGFVHNPASYQVTGHNGSRINTLNGNTDGIRGKRSSLVFFDEVGFMPEEHIVVAEAFGVQNSGFVLTVDKTQNMKSLFKKTPNQFIYASSASSTDTYFYKKYREFAKNMISGDRRYFVADIPCTIPLNPLNNGKPVDPLLSQETIDDVASQSPERARREYYNEFSTDGGDQQPIKRATILKNSNFVLPILSNPSGKDQFVFAYDPARSNDNSILSVMRIRRDETVGYYGEIVNCVSFADVAKKKKTPMTAPAQEKLIKKLLLEYNGGNSAEYENILGFFIDAGAGGGGVQMADYFLEDWVDEKGKKHRGLIDTVHEQYQTEISKFPNAYDLIRLINPRKYKTQMVEDLVRLLSLDLIKFPEEYKGKEVVNLNINEEGKPEEYALSMEEHMALFSIDAMKEESYAIRETKSGVNVSYDTAKEKQGKIGDDRFYTLIMLAHFLENLRRKDKLDKPKEKFDWANAPRMVSVINF